MAAPPQHSADRRWWWDGQRWHPAISPDGLWRFDGHGWKPIDPPHRDWLAGCAVAIAAHGIALLAAIGLALVGVAISIYLVIFLAGQLRAHG
jgi:hypothetical protein